MSVEAPSFDELTAAGTGEPLPVAEHWSGFGGAHGGLMVAALARAIEREAARPLRAVHADLLGAVRPGMLDVEPVIDRAGRTVTYASAMGSQDGSLRLRATAVLGDGPGEVDRGLAHLAARLDPPAVPPSADCPEWEGDRGPALSTVRFRPATANLPLQASGHPEFHVWLAIAGDDAPLDPWRLLTLCDAPAPGLFAMMRDPLPMPTVELGAQLLPAARDPRGRWALARMRTIASAEGWSVDDCELWDEAGRPLLLSRQTRRIPL